MKKEQNECKPEAMRYRNSPIRPFAAAIKSETLAVVSSNFEFNRSTTLSFHSSTVEMICGILKEAKPTLSKKKTRNQTGNLRDPSNHALRSLDFSSWVAQGPSSKLCVSHRVRFHRRNTPVLRSPALHEPCSKTGDSFNSNQSKQHEPSENKTSILHKHMWRFVLQ